MMLKLRNIRPVARSAPLVRAPYRMVSSLPVDKAIEMIAIDACDAIEGGRDHLGEMWEAAYAYMDRHARRMVVQANGSLVAGARRHVSTIQIETFEQDEVLLEHPPTTEDEMDALFASSWLEEQLELLDERTRRIVRNGLGLDERRLTLDRMGVDLDISSERVRQILRDSVASLAMAWRRRARDAALVVEFGDCKVILPDEPERTKKRHRAVPPKIMTGRRTCDVHVRYVDGAILTYGMTIRRTDHDRYTIDDGDAKTADEIAGRLIDAIGPDPHERESKRKAIANRDTAIADAMRWIANGAGWPTLVHKRILLPILAA